MDRLQHFVARYRSALLLKAALLGVLGAAVAGALGWRLTAARPGAAWSVGVPIALALGWVLWLAWRVRRAWISSRSGAAYLDGQLGLQQRLVTAAEFSDRPAPPALYPLLVEDTAGRVTDLERRLPRPWDRSAGILTALLAILLLWPRAGGLHPQLAALLPAPATPPSPQPDGTTPPPPDAPQQPQDRKDQGGGGGTDPNQGQGPDQSRGQNQGQEQGAQAPSSSGGGSQDQSKTGNGERGAGSDRQGKGAGQQQQAAQSGDSGREGQTGASGQRGESNRQAASGQSQRGGQGGTSPSPGGQEALKAEIQQLLREVSGELQELQQQLAASAPQDVAAPGVGTDPQLYESPMPLDPLRGTQLPIQLPADTVETKTPRPGSGVGEASREVLREGPTAKPEDAQLSDQPLEEPSSDRQAVPPEYRSVFDQLRGTTAPSAEATPNE
jgi:hypothetical protein